MKDHYGQIYKIENKINNKVYIGQTILDDVFKERYGYNVEKNTHNLHLKNSIKKYGWDNFQISILEYCESRDQLNEKERYWIKYYNSTNPNCGYNIDAGGHMGGSEETKIKISEMSKKYWDTHPEEKAKRSQLYSGNNNPLAKAGGHTDDAKSRMSDIRKKQIEDGIIDMKKVTEASMNPESIRKRVISRSKFLYVQYDLNMNELNKWHTLKDMHDYLVKNMIENHYISYKIYKLSYVQNKIFIDQMYKDQGFYFYKIPKDEYINIAS